MPWRKTFSISIQVPERLSVNDEVSLTTQHWLTLDKIILHDKWVKNNPVDEGYEESHRGCAGLKAPGKWVESRESVWDAGAGPQSAAQHDPGINEIMEGEQSNTCRGHWWALSIMAIYSYKSAGEF